jgi:gluconate/galactonate dehydratase
VRITRIEVAVVLANYDYTFVRVHADRDGLFGTGECFFAPGLTGILADAAPLLIGHDPRQVERLVRLLLRRASGAGLAGIYNAVSGIEAALLDLTGKALGAPVYQLLGGKLRDQVRVYADCHAGAGLESWGPMLTPRRPRWFPPRPAADDLPDTFTPAAYAERALAALAKGFDALKFDIDSLVVTTGGELYRPLTADEIDRMAACGALVREAVGPAVDVAVDCHWRFSPADAVRVCRRLEHLNLMWIEDPCEAANWADTAEVKRRSITPILTGENLLGRHGFAPLLEGRACDLIAPDLQKCGGLLEGRLIGQLADLHGIRVAPHCIAGPLGLLASAHACATLANFVVLEFHGQDVPFWDDLVVGEPVIVKGRVTLAERPGLGAELNEDVVREFARAGDEPWRVLAS